MCPYFESETMDGLDLTAKLRQEEYCLDNPGKCARFKVYKVLGMENVPKDLLPFEVDRAKEIIESAPK
jgi:hypothetical protein